MSANILFMKPSDQPFTAENVDVSNTNIDISEVLEKMKEDESLFLFYLSSLIKIEDYNKIIFLHQNGHFQPSLIEKIFQNAAHLGKIEMIRYFHQNGLNLQSEVGYNALYKAIMSDHDEVLKYFHQNGFAFFNVFIDHLSTLCGLYGSLKCLTYLCQNGIFIIDEAQNYMALALFSACYGNNLNIIKYLYKNGINIEGELSQKIFKEANKSKKFDIIIYYCNSCEKYQAVYNSIVKTCDLSFFIVPEDELKYEHDLVNIEKIEKNNIDPKLCYYLAISNGHTFLFHFLKNAFPFLACNDIELEALELALINNRSDIVSVFLSGDKPHLKNISSIRKLIKSVVLFSDISIIELLIEYYIKNNINIYQKLLYFAAFNKRLDIIIHLHEIKGVSLRIFQKIRTTDLEEGPVRSFLSDRRLFNELKEDLTLINQMQEEVMRDKAIFHPSHFWNFFNEINIIFLKNGGFRNFKRNINQ